VRTVIGRISLFAALTLTPIVVSGQQAAAALAVEVRSSPAYAEVLLRKVELTADLESFAADYTDQNPKVLEARSELASIEKAIDRLRTVKPAEAAKLTLALGKLLVKRASLETDFARLSRSFAADHPQVKRAKRQVEIFDAAINQIL